LIGDGSTASAVCAELDLRFNGRLEREISSVFNRLSYELRGPFNDLVTQLSLPHTASLDWWVEGPASRNTFASPFFHHYCCLHLVRHIVDRGQFAFDCVVVDSRALKGVLGGLLADAGVKQCRIEYAPGASVTWKKLLKRTIATPLLLARKLCQFLIARVTRDASRTTRPTDPVVLIDTFMTSAYTTSDRWYGSLWENLTDEMKTETFFVPTIVLTPLRAMYSTYKSLRSNPRPFIIKEDYLRLDDLLFVWGHRRRMERAPIAPVKVLGHDISGIVKEELAGNRDPLTTIESLLTFRFIKRLSESGLNVRLVIDWFEGQVIDKAWNLGFKRYFPTATRVGYRAAGSFPFYLCSYPISIERESGVIPDTMAVQGQGTIATVREFLPDLDVIAIPSFKAQYVWAFRAAKNPSVFTVLAALPISVHSSVRIINRLIDVVAWHGADKDAMQIIVKPHPTVSADTLRRKLSVDLPGALVFTDERSFSRLLEQAHVLITEASSTCLEALACGVPVIIVESDAGLTYDPVPSTVPADLYRRTRTQPELAAALTHYMSWSEEDAQRQELQGQRVKALYFEPITREGIERFMNIDARQKAPNA
jgi:hypothetical protein